MKNGCTFASAFDQREGEKRDERDGCWRKDIEKDETER
mgnify:CR=1 FL=1